MIPSKALDEWQRVVPWTSPHEIEQDLVLARLIAEVAQHPVVGSSLALKGGTCLHKLWLPEPWRYSEDLDYDIRGDVSLDDVKNAIASDILGTRSNPLQAGPPADTPSAADAGEK
ncbi:MAG: nucleotidyl transferase AbiEii/AbiGii toxin family protein [Acidimicrobiaceae bacterium]|nr:nucleotidyl transferase AbiEii/AbiGii toxin family protein [Acidimicrobiaceae bacterium]